VHLGWWQVACPEWTDFDRPQGVRTVDDGRQIPGARLERREDGALLAASARPNDDPV
jgi:hypothetical protein